MAIPIAENKMLHPALRALQFIFAIIVMGTNGYAINVYHGHTSRIHSPFGDYDSYFGVPNSWGFLLFCAAWTVLAVIFVLLTGNVIPDRAFIGYVRIAVELVAVLSWFAGWIAVAVDIGTGACEAGYVSCGTLQAATVFGAMEWLLFMGTTYLTISLVMSSRYRMRASMT